jgi:hypothetical protein
MMLKPATEAAKMEGVQIVQARFKPVLAIEFMAFGEENGSAHASKDAMVPARDFGIDDFGARQGHGEGLTSG